MSSRQPKDFREIIDWFDTYRGLGEALGAAAPTVKQWRRRNRVPAEYWSALVREAAKHGIALTCDHMAALAEKLWRE